MRKLIQTFIILLIAILIPLSNSTAQVTDARLRDDMQAKHYEPGGKYHLFGGGRGGVQNRVYAVQTFSNVATGPILPISHERESFEGIIAYETHFSGHGHEVHGPFDNHASRSHTDFRGGVAGGFTVYSLHRTGSEIHPADGYDGPQGGGYPAPQGARDIYSYYVKGTATKTKINSVPLAPLTERMLQENAKAQDNFVERLTDASHLIHQHNPNLNSWGNTMEVARGSIQAAANPLITAYEGLGITSLIDSAKQNVTEYLAQQALQGVHDLGNVDTSIQLQAAESMQDSAFAAQAAINSAQTYIHQKALENPNVTATAQTAVSAFGAAATITGVSGKVVKPITKVITPPTSRKMSQIDGEMAGGNKPPKAESPVPSNFLKYIQKEYQVNLANVFKGKDDLQLTNRHRFTAAPESNRANTTKVFDSSKLSDQELRAAVFEFAEKLGGQKPTKREEGIWVIKTPEGVTINVREVSSSQVSNGKKARWTMDIIDTKLNQMIGDKISISDPTKKREIKFK